MKNLKVLKIVMSIILIFSIVFLDTIFYNNIAYAESGKSSLEPLDSFKTRNWRKFTKIKR